MLVDRVRRVWGYLADNLALSMGCLFRCFRDREIDAGHKLCIAVSEPVKPPEKSGSRKILSSLLLAEEQSSVDVGSKRQGSESPENNNEEVDLKDEAKFLKACGAVLQTPAEIRSGSDKIGTVEGENLSARFNSWFYGASQKQRSTCDSPSLASPPTVLHGGCVRPSMKEGEAQPSKDEKNALSDHTLSRSSSKDHAENIINQSLIKTVRFQTDFTPNLSNEKHNIQNEYDSPGSEGKKAQVDGKRHSPKPTPLIVSNGMQTPGTVYPTKLEILGNGKSTWVRPQYVYPVHNADNISKCDMSKDATTDSTKVEEVSSGLSSSDRKFDLERPIIGGVAVYWDDKDQTEVSPKEWDGNGIPNSTTKYKEDQRVSWHATPFEERLEKALSDERLQPRRAINELPIYYESEENDTATSFPTLTDIAV